MRCQPGDGQEMGREWAGDGQEMHRRWAPGSAGIGVEKGVAGDGVKHGMLKRSTCYAASCGRYLLRPRGEVPDSFET